MKPRYDIGDTVFHCLPEGERGMVIDIRYYFLTSSYEYFVTFGVGRSGWVYESEITAKRKF